jgi:hypothetical protein
MDEINEKKKRREGDDKTRYIIRIGRGESEG